MLHWAPTTTLSGALWFLCVCVTLTVNTDVSLSRTWCYASDSEDGVPHTLSCNRGNVLWVASAEPSIHTANRRGFCRTPASSGSDCPLEAASHTDQYRRVCHGRESCTFLLTRRPPNTCPGVVQGPMYLHLRYSCVQATDADGHTYPTIHPGVSEWGRAASGELWLLSTGYPMDYEDMADTRCTLLANQDTRLEVSVLDLGVEVDVVQQLRQEARCPYSLTVGNHSAVCARPGRQTSTLTILPPGGSTTGGSTGGSTTGGSETDVHIALPEPGPVRGRYWVRVTGYEGDSVVPAPFSVTCTNPLSRHVAPSTGNESPSIVHIVVPVVILLIIIIIILVIVGILLWRRRRRRAQEEEGPGVAPEDVEGAHPEEVRGLWGEALNSDSKDGKDSEGEAGEDENLNKRRPSHTEETGPDGPGTEWAGGDRPGTEETGPDKTGTDGPGTDRGGTEETGTPRAETDRAWTDRAGTEETGPDRTGTDRAGTEETGPDGPGTDGPEGDTPAEAHRTTAV